MSYPMTTADEMRAIAATWSAQGVQESFPLAAAGYVEVPAHLPRFKPLPDAVWLRDMTARYGHCGQ